MDDRTITEQLTAAIEGMEASGQSQRALADRADVDVGRISRLLHSGRGINGRTMDKLCDYLGLALLPRQTRDYSNFFSMLPSTATEQLIRAVKEKGHSLRTIAKLSLVDHTGLARFLRREQGIRSDNLDRLCKHLELELQPRKKQQ